MNRFIAVFVPIFVWASSASAREGYVETRAGEVYEGHIRFESNTVIIVNAARDLWAQVRLTNILELTFLEDAGGDGGRGGSFDPPGAWQSEDVGSVRFAGGADRAGATFRVRGSGTNILSGSDAFHFVFKPMRGDAQILARVARVSPTDPWARAGLMMREGLAADARNVLVSVTSARGGVFQWRERSGDETNVSLDRALAVPAWLKLRRDGNLFTALKSANGKQWTEIERVVLKAADDLYVGLAVTGVQETALNESLFEGVEVGRWLRSRWFVPQVELRSTSVERGHLASMDDSAIHFDRRPAKTPVSRTAVANIRFQPLPQRAGALLSSGRSGVLLNSGEFVDGDCRAIVDGKLILNSVPLGLCRYDLSSDVVAIVLAKRGQPTPPPCQITTGDGAVWVGSELNCDQDSLSIREPALGLRRIPLAEVREVRRRLPPSGG